MSASNFVYLQVAEITRETDKAFQFVLQDGEETWIPFSQIPDCGDYAVGMTNLEVAVTEWIARQKGLEGRRG